MLLDFYVTKIQWGEAEVGTKPPVNELVDQPPVAQELNRTFQPETPADQHTPATLLTSNDPYKKVTLMLNTLGLSHLLENFKAELIQDQVLSCDPAGLKEAMVLHQELSYPYRNILAR